MFGKDHVKLSEMERKYELLVACVRYEDGEIYGEALEKFPEDVASLEGENLEYQHGFNTGMLAALKLILDLEESCEVSKLSVEEFEEDYGVGADPQEVSREIRTGAWEEFPAVY